MLRNASAVIGSAFGDEGKGLMTDLLAFEAGDMCTVIRFNGGAQAGHTVHTPDGRRHVFHQFGSGAFAGASTHLSRFFVTNPIVFQHEREVLLSLEANIDVSISGDALVSTPWDMFANTEIESSRGGDRHGSCGLGIGETVGRQEETAYGLQIRDLDSRDLARRLRSIRDEWLPDRFAHLGIKPDSDRYSVIRSDALFDRFLDDLSCFRTQVTISEISNVLMGRQAIFEGAQGLLLDQNAGAPWFPHVTRSNTGLQNVLELAAEAGLETLDVHYMARIYLTRHGAGPLPFEYGEKPFPAIVDDTNIPNAWQGNLRFAPLNVDLLGRAIARDLATCRSKPTIRVRPCLAMTCLDQVDGPLEIVSNGKLAKVAAEEAVETAERSALAGNASMSFGPTRRSILYAG
jgi:adenylosuccinate synthase